MGKEFKLEKIINLKVFFRMEKKLKVDSFGKTMIKSINILENFKTINFKELEHLIRSMVNIEGNLKMG